MLPKTNFHVIICIILDNKVFVLYIFVLGKSEVGILNEGMTECTIGTTGLATELPGLPLLSSYSLNSKTEIVCLMS